MRDRISCISCRCMVSLRRWGVWWWWGWGWEWGRDKTRQWITYRIYGVLYIRVNTTYPRAREQSICMLHDISISVAYHTSHITHHTSHITHHTSHITHHTSHVTHHTSHIIHHTSYITHHIYIGNVVPSLGRYLL